MSTRMLSGSSLPITYRACDGGVPTYSPRRTLTCSTLPSMGERTMTRSRSVTVCLDLGLGDGDVGLGDVDVVVPGPGLEQHADSPRPAASDGGPASARSRLCSIVLLRHGVLRIKLLVALGRVGLHLVVELGGIQGGLQRRHFFRTRLPQQLLQLGLGGKSDSPAAARAERGADGHRRRRAVRFS